MKTRVTMLVWRRLFFFHLAWCTTLVAVGLSIKRPLPTSITAPSGTTLMFTCEVNTTELSLGITFDRIVWFLNDEFLVNEVNQKQAPSEDGQLRFSKLSLLVSEPASSTLQCSLDVRNNGVPVPDFSRSKNATFTVYGMMHVEVL